MSYLEKRSWKRVKFSPGTKKVQKASLWKCARSAMIMLAAFLLVGIVGGNFLSQPEVYFNPYKGVCGTAYAAVPGKPLDFRITNNQFFSKFVNGVFPLSNTVSIVAKGNGEKLGTDLDAIRFAAENVQKEYLNYPAIDWICPSRLLASGKTMTEAMGVKNLSTSFQAVPYRKFKTISKNIHSSPSHMLEAYLKLGNMQGLEQGFERKFADGKTRLIKPNDTWLLLRPNTHGLWRKSDTDLQLGSAAIDPEESLPLALYIHTDLCDWKTGEWDKKNTQWLVARNFAIAYGIYLDPSAIQIVGKGLQTRFVYNKKLDVDMVIVRWAENQMKPDWKPDEKLDKPMDVPVRVVNSDHELCFWGSNQPDQSIVIPFSYLARIDNDTELLLGDGSEHITFQDILDDIQQVRENRGSRRYEVYGKAGSNGPNSAAGYDLSAYITKTPRLTTIANRAIGDAKTPDEAVEQLMAYIETYLPYVSDHRGDKSLSGYDGPVEVLMPPLVSLMNRGKDCDGHAILGAALFLAADHPALAGKNQYCAISVLNYGGIGHAMPLLPNIGKLETDPFPNHVLLPINGVDVPFIYTEPTGAGDDPLHQSKPQQRGYEPEFLTLVKGWGLTREISIIGFNQFQYAQHVQQAIN